MTTSAAGGQVLDSCVALPMRRTVWHNPSALQRTWLIEMGVDKKLLTPVLEEPHASPAKRASGGDKAQVITVTPVSPAVASRVDGPVEALRLLAGKKNTPLSKSFQVESRPTDHLPQPPVMTETLASVSSASVIPVPDSSKENLPTDLLALNQAVSVCVRCELHKSRGKAVPGAGVMAPDWLIVGEAPTLADDAAGQPFQGKAGELLDAMLASVGLSRSHALYLTHLVKCRPLGNRAPDTDEIEACRSIIRAQIKALQPKGIVALGHVAAWALSQQRVDLDSLRHQQLTYTTDEGLSLPLVVTYHPAALLLKPQYKALAWRDLQHLRT